jgi:hypothetical protein
MARLNGCGTLHSHGVQRHPSARRTTTKRPGRKDAGRYRFAGMRKGQMRPPTHSVQETVLPPALTFSVTS